MFEYLSYLEGISFLSEIYRTLKPNAIHGIVVPDLRAFALVYLQDNSFLLQKYKESTDSNGTPRAVASACMAINITTANK